MATHETNKLSAATQVNWDPRKRTTLATPWPGTKHNKRVSFHADSITHLIPRSLPASVQENDL